MSLHSYRVTVVVSYSGKSSDDIPIGTVTLDVVSVDRAAAKRAAQQYVDDGLSIGVIQVQHRAKGKVVYS